ncbi:MAG: beta-aspartyl-peptidase [Candidatus Thermoplasmatota archaeon]|nr:beta-aspartyl-peptidase [Candidatus Thermoplasmatota archaeon]
MNLIKNVEVYAPEDIGKKDLLISNGKITSLKKNIDEGSLSFLEDLKVIDASNQIALPGFIDHHIHFNGAGGEGGPKNRTPPLQLTDMTRGGITSAVGLLGADGKTRSLKDLLMKARALEEEGISTWIYTGAYQVPSPTITEDVLTDIITIDKVIGVKVALSDHRSSHPTLEEVRRITSDARVGGMLAGDAGIVNIHMGDEESGLDPLLEIIEETNIPIEQFAPTHINRNEQLLEQGIEFAKKGGYIDITVGEPSEETGKGPSRTVKEILDEGVPANRIKLSTDAGGSLPEFDEDGNLVGMRSASPVHLKKVFKEMVKEKNIPIEDAIRITSTNIADQLKLNNKGTLKKGKDADLLLLNQDTLEIEHVIAKGEIMIENGEPVKYGAFE